MEAVPGHWGGCPEPERHHHRLARPDDLITQVDYVDL